MEKDRYHITINRLYGSGGRIMGKKLSAELGIPFYDEEILKMASEESAIGEQYFRINDEKAGNNLFFRAVGAQSCIIMGRCADFVLGAADFPNLVRLFVYADSSTCIRRVMEVDGVDTKEALRRANRISKERRDYYKYYTGKEWEDMDNYDLPINTTTLELDPAVELVKEYLRLRNIRRNLERDDIAPSKASAPPPEGPCPKDKA